MEIAQEGMTPLRGFDWGVRLYHVVLASCMFDSALCSKQLH